MPASGLVDYDDGVIIAAIPIEARNAPAQRDREDARAIAFSLLLHLAIFLALLGWFRLDLPGLTPSLAFPMEVELVDGRELEDDDPALKELTGRTASFAEEMQQATAPSRPSAGIASQAVDSSPAVPAPGQPNATDRETASDESVPGESPAPQDSPLLATQAREESKVPVRADDPAEPRPVEMPVTQQMMLARHVMEGLRNFDDPRDMPSKFSWMHEGQAYTALLERQPASGETDIERVSIEIEADDQGRRRKTRLEMKRLAFSHFTQLVDQWDTEVQLHDDEIEGRFHSNSAIVLGYDRSAMPRFLGKVTTAARGYTFGERTGYRRRNDIFRGGFEASADRVVLPTRFLRPPDTGVQVHTFPDDARITFYPDGSYGWGRPRSGADEGRELIASPTYLIAAPRVTLYLRGVVAGQVTVYSPDRIVIEGDLKYARDPRARGDTNDCLGLVSDRNIEIARSAITGRGDLEIDGALYARRRFIVTDIDAPWRATLVIYGSLTAGSLSATEPRYATKIRYDTRFEWLRPPGFPVTNRYEIEGWKPLWKYVEGAG